jgi:uncharacterized protein
MRAAKFWQIRAAKTLIEKKEDLNSAAKGGATALMIASERGEFEFVKLLIEHQVDVNPKSRNGTTPVIRAAAGANK